jgi:hypothetical protein
MKKNKALLILLFLIFQNSFSQSILNGKVVSDALNLDKIIVINVSNNKTAGTNIEGGFRILAKPSDTLYFSGNQIKGVKVILKKDDFYVEPFEVKLFQQIKQLEEVVIKKNQITALSLGIINKPIQVLTPAERRLAYRTGRFTPNTDGTSGFAIGLEPLFSSISGQKSQLVKELQVEKKELSIDKLAYLFDDDFYISKLKIPSELIKGFQYFAVEDLNLIEILKSKNESLIIFKLIQIAENFRLATFQKKE